MLKMSISAHGNHLFLWIGFKQIILKIDDNGKIILLK